MSFDWQAYIPRIARDAYGGVPLAVIAAIVISVALLIGNAGLLVISSVRTLDANSQYAHSFEGKRALAVLESAIGAVQSAQQAWFSTREPDERTAFLSAISRARADLASLNALIAREPASRRSVGSLVNVRLEGAAALELAENSLESDASQSPLKQNSEASAAETAAMTRLRQLQVLLPQLLAEEQARIDRSRAEVSNRIWMMVAVAVFATIVTVLVLVALQRLLRRYVAARMAAEAALLNANEQLNREVEERTSELTDLSRHLIRVSEEEKASLARELHDALGSNLAAIGMDLNWVAKRLPEGRDELRDRLQRALRMVVDTVELKHQVIEGLRPSQLDNLGLTFAIRTHCSEFTRLTGMPCAMDVQEDFDDLDPQVAIVLYRVAQEALTNVMKHAHARNVQVTLAREDEGLRLRIRDDGVGFAAASTGRRNSHGLVGMRERVRQVGGTFRAMTPEQGGALVEVFIPLAATYEKDAAQEMLA